MQIRQLWPERNVGMQFSIREALFVVAFVALGLGSMNTGGLLASVTLCVAAVVVLAYAIVAFVGRGDSQAFAIGLLIPVSAYAILVFGIGVSELDPYRSKLPTSRLLRPMFSATTSDAWVRAGTGDFIRYADPRADAESVQIRSLTLSSQGNLGDFAVRSEWPPRQEFMSVGHVLFAMLMGYIGGKFAINVRSRNSGVATKHDET